MGTSTNSRQQRAVMYLRLAASKQALSRIDLQRDGCQRIAARHGLTVVREYADIGRAARLEQQVELLRLLDDLYQKRDVGYVIIWDYARLARSMEQLNQIIHHIHSCGAAVATISGVEAADRFLRERQREQSVQEEV